MKIPKFEGPIYITIIIIAILSGLIYIYISLKKEKKWNSLFLLFFILSLYMSLVFGKLFTFLIDPTTNFFKSGLTSYGGAFGFMVASIIFDYIVHLDKKLIKYSIIALPLMYGIAKVGCFLSGCCYGIPYDGILSIRYTYDLNIGVFPVQLLETIIFLIIFVVLNKLRDNKNILFISIIVMSIFKFILDFLRYEHYLKGITINQIFSIIILIISIIIFISKKRLLKVEKDNI